MWTFSFFQYSPLTIEMNEYILDFLWGDLAFHGCYLLFLIGPHDAYLAPKEWFILNCFLLCCYWNMNLDSEIIDLFFSSSKYGTYWFLHVADLTCNVYMYFTGMLFYCIDLYARKHGDYWWSSSWFIIPTGTHYIEWKYILELVLLSSIFWRRRKTGQLFQNLNSYFNNNIKENSSK
jgi:hypothetical protein